MRQDKREEVIKSFTVPNKNATAGSKEDRKNPMVMLLSLKVRPIGSSVASPDCADVDLVRPALSDST